MKLEIDTDNKTIIIDGEASIQEVLDYLSLKELSEWKIKSKELVIDDSWVYKRFWIEPSYIVPPLPPYYPPYIVTC